MTFRFLVQKDARLSERLRVAEQPGPLRKVSAFFASSGDSWFWLAGLIVLWRLGNSFWREWAVVQMAGILVLAALVMSIKFLVRRRRPEGEWGQVYRSADPHSFPSGHAARAFLVAVLATGLGPAGLTIILWIWAPLVALARVAMGVHYVSDILAGAALGVGFAWVVLQVYKPLFSSLSALIGFPLW